MAIINNIIVNIKYIFTKYTNKINSSLTVPEPIINYVYDVKNKTNLVYKLLY